MKRILSLAVIALLALTSRGFCDVATATMGDQNSSNVYRLTAYSGNSSGTQYGYLTYAQDTGLFLPYVANATTNTTLTAYQSGTTIIFGNGAGVALNGTQYTLPAATVGMEFTIASDVAKWFYVDPNGTDTIKILNFVAGGRVANISSAAAGDSITLFCGVAGSWTIKAKSGTWAYTP